MSLDDIDLIIDLHRGAARLGPGGREQTQRAVTLSGLANNKDLHIADIGCGTGACTLVLAETLGARVSGVDVVPEFVADLNAEARQRGVDDRVNGIVASMSALPFAAASLDAIWSEGAVYNVGFAAGVQYWRQFLKPGGILAVSDLTWLTNSRPAELTRHWEQEYPGVDTAAARLAILESSGFAPLGYFVLPPHCWLDNYYHPMQARFADFLARHSHSSGAQALVQAEQAEIALYEAHQAYFSYGYYIARKLAE